MEVPAPPGSASTAMGSIPRGRNRTAPGAFRNFSMLRHLLLCATLLLAPAAFADVPREHVILLHGLARTSKSMEPLERSLTAAGYRVLNINYDSREGSVEQLSELAIGSALDLCQQEHAQ